MSLCLCLGLFWVIYMLVHALTHSGISPDIVSGTRMVLLLSKIKSDAPESLQTCVYCAASRALVHDYFM